MSDNLTKDGVCYDLSRSPFYQFRNGFIFYFSSHSHLLKFNEKARVKEEWLNDSLSRRFHYQVDVTLLADFQLYHQIEKRGFHVRNAVTGEVLACQDSVLFDGLKVKLTDCATW